MIDIKDMEIMESSCVVPPGFRFHPTEEELVGYYLQRKVNSSQKIDLDVIIDIDLYRIEPWDIQGRCKLGYEEQNEWYFFSYKDRKYPTGTRTNRATTAGFWKATGRDKAVLSKERIIGMRKTLVFYKGRAPNGRKTDWIMHEYRLQTTDQHGPPQEEGWVVCRAFKKPSRSHQQGFDACWNSSSYHARCYRALSYSNIPPIITLSNNPNFHSQGINHIQPLFPPPDTFKSGHNHFESPIVEEIPKLDSPSISASFTMSEKKFEHAAAGIVGNEDIEDEKSFLGGQYYCSEWKSLDGLLTSQVFVPSSAYAYTSMSSGTKDDLS